MKVFNKANFKEAMKENHWFGFVASILTIAIGLIMIIFPFFTQTVFAIVYVTVFIIGLIVGGIYRIAQYSNDKRRGLANPFNLVSAIINLAVGVMLLGSLIQNSIYYSTHTDVSFSYALMYNVNELFYWCIYIYAFYGLFRGIFRLVTLGRLPMAIGWYERSVAISEICLGAFFIIASWFNGDQIIVQIILVVLGVYVLFRGIIMFIDKIMDVARRRETAPRVSDRNSIKDDKKDIKDGNVIDAEIVDERDDISKMN